MEAMRNGDFQRLLTVQWRRNITTVELRRFYEHFRPTLSTIDDVAFKKALRRFWETGPWLVVFPFVFVIVSCHWLFIAIVNSYISLFKKPARSKQHNFTLHCMHSKTVQCTKLVTGIK